MKSFQIDHWLIEEHLSQSMLPLLEASLCLHDDRNVSTVLDFNTVIANSELEMEKPNRRFARLLKW